MKIWISVVFLIQFITQMLLKFGYGEYGDSSPMHEDLVTTIIGCTAILIYTLCELKENR